MKLNQEVRIVGDSKGVLWKITLDKHKGIGKIERVSCLNEEGYDLSKLNGSEYEISTESSLQDDMQNLTTVIESRFKAA